MTDRPPTLQSFFAELKRRRVFRVMAVYGAVAFVVLQVADIAFEPLGLPPWTMTLVLFLALVGFPIAVVLAWAFETTPEGVRRTAQASPQEIEELVAAPRRHRWPAGLLALASMLLLFGTGWWMGGGGRGGSAAGNRLVSQAQAADIKAIAALPFEDVNGTEDNRLVAVGIHEDLVTQLQRIAALRVTSRTSVREYADTDKSLKEIAGELGVQYILEGSVRSSGSKARVNVSLVDAGADEGIWSDQYDVDVSPDSLFAVQSRISRSVVAELQAHLTAADERTLEEIRPAASSVASQWYYRGLDAFERSSGTDVSPAVEAMQRAIELDSGYVAAWSKLAKYASRQAFIGGGEGPVARDAMERTERLAPGSVEAHLARGYYEYYAQGNYEAALSAFRAAERSAPSDADVAEALGLILRRQGHWEESTEMLKRAAALDPRNGGRLAFLGENLAFQGAFQDADVVFDRALSLASSASDAGNRKIANLVLLDRSTDRARRLAGELRLDPADFNDATTLAFLAMYDRDFEHAVEILDWKGTGNDVIDTWMQLGRAMALQRLEEARSAVVAESAYTALSGLASPAGNVAFQVLKGNALALAGRSEKARTILRDAASEIRTWNDQVDGLRSGYEVVIGYGLLGELDPGFEMLDDLIDRPSLDLSVAALQLDPFLDPYRDDPRFAELVQRREAYEAKGAELGEAGRPWLP
jgi:TolB-like protein/tetratricopeptide (TPR) repeat protein